MRCATLVQRYHHGLRSRARIRTCVVVLVMQCSNKCYEESRLLQEPLSGHLGLVLAAGAGAQPISDARYCRGTAALAGRATGASDFFKTVLPRKSRILIVGILINVITRLLNTCVLSKIMKVVPKLNSKQLSVYDEAP